MLQRFKNAFHNIIIHPLAGLCWLFGLESLGDWLHGNDKPFLKIGSLKLFQENNTVFGEMEGEKWVLAKYSEEHPDKFSLIFFKSDRKM